MRFEFPPLQLQLRQGRGGDQGDSDCGGIESVQDTTSLVGTRSPRNDCLACLALARRVLRVRR